MWFNYLIFEHCKGLGSLSSASFLSPSFILSISCSWSSWVDASLTALLSFNFSSSKHILLSFPFCLLALTVVSFLCCAIILSLSKTLVHSRATSAWHDSNSCSNSQIRRLEILFSNSRWASFAWTAVSTERNWARDQLNRISNLYQWIIWNAPLVSRDASLPLYS